MKKFLQTIMAIMLVIGVFIAPSIALADSDGSTTTEEVVNEKFGAPIVVYGGNLTEDQKDSVKESLKITDKLRYSRN